MEDVALLAQQVRELELAANEHILALDMAAIEAETSPDLIHFTIFGERIGRADFLRMMASNPERRAIEAGPMDAIVVSPDAVLLSYTLGEHTLSGNERLARYEQVSILWMKRRGLWQGAFIHATSRPSAQIEMLSETQENPEVAKTLVVNNKEVEAIDETLLETRKEKVIALEKEIVDCFCRHDIQGAAALTHDDCLLIEPDGSRQGKAHWLALVGDKRRILQAPTFGPFEIIVITPQAILVAYTLENQGAYDGAALRSFEALSTLWAYSDGTWQAIFMQATIRQ